MTNPPDVGMFLLSHQALRRDAARVEAAVRRLDASSATDAAALAEAFGVFEQMLVHHHRAEDDLVWPAVRERRPDLTRVVDELEAEHVTVDGLLDTIRTGLAELASDASVDRARVHDAVVAAAAVLTGDLAGHLAREEAIVVPAIQDSLTAQEWEDLDARRKASLAPEEMALSLAWVLSALPDDTREALAAEKLPPPVVAMWREQWAPAYAQRVAVLAAAAA